MQRERVDLSLTLDDQLNDPPLDTLRYFNRCRLKSAFDSIFQKYGRDFEESDVVDISTGEVIEDKGFLKKTPQKKLGSLFKPKDEKFPFTADIISILEPVTSSSTEEESSKETPTKTRNEKDVYEEEDFESILAQETPRLSRTFPPFFPLPSLGYQQTPFPPSPLNPLYDTSKKTADFNDTRSTVSKPSKIVSSVTKPLFNTTELTNSHLTNAPLQNVDSGNSSPGNLHFKLKESDQTFLDSSPSAPPQGLTLPSPGHILNLIPKESSDNVPHTPIVEKRKREHDENIEASETLREMKISKVTPKNSPFKIEVLVEKKPQDLLNTFTNDLDNSMENLSPGSYVSSKVAGLISIKQAALNANLTAFPEYEGKHLEHTEGSQDDESQSIVYDYFETSGDYLDDENPSSYNDVNLLAASHTTLKNNQSQASSSSSEPKPLTVSNECKGYGQCTKAFCFDCTLAESENGLL